MNILITGATGFIGKHLVSRLLSDDNNLFITLLSNEVNPFNNIIGFTLDGDYIEKLINFLTTNQVEGIIHLASFVQSGEHKTNEIVSLLDTNVKFSTVLLECAVVAKVKWFINTGTFWQHYENKDYSPVNLYAATKQAFESIAQYYIETNKIKFVSLHLSDTYGPNDTRPKIFNLWEKIAKTGETLDMSPGEQIIDISHVDDVVESFIRLAKKLYNNDVNIENGFVFAVRAPQRYTLRELAKKYEKENNVKLNINWGGRPYRTREVMNPYLGETLPE